jgi:hypothetical protein
MGPLQQVAPPEGFIVDPPEEWAGRVVLPQFRAYNDLPEGYVLDDPVHHSFKPSTSPDKMKQRMQNLKVPEGFVLNDGGGRPPSWEESRQNNPRTGLFLSEDGKGNVGPGAIPQALMDIWEDMKLAVGSGGKDEKAVTRLAGALAAGGFARGALSKGSGELGVFGGKLVEGGKKTVERNIDELSANLANALKNVEKPDLKAAGQSIKELKTHAEALAKQEKELLPDLSKMTEADLKRLGMTLEQYKTLLLQNLDAEISAGQREVFKVLSGGRDPNKPVTVENIVQWLKDAGVENVKVATKGSWDTTYLTFKAGPTGGRKTVRLGDHLTQSPHNKMIDATGMDWQKLIDSLFNKFGLQ